MNNLDQITEYLLSVGIPYRENVSGAECTTFRTGGSITLLAEPNDTQKAYELLSFTEKNGVPCYLIGNGSNLLIPDDGADKLFIRLSGSLCSYKIENGLLICGGGASLAAAAKHSVFNGWSGLEWASGIPGTVGGAVAMNAGAYGGEIKNVLSGVTYYANGNLYSAPADIGSMGYRVSPYSFPDAVILEARFRLVPDDGYARARMDDYSMRRREKQPLNYPSAGSTFKRPEGHFAGALIEGAGLKGLSVGGAAVSRKHAGFIINENNATSSDIIDLIELVKLRVFEKYGVTLEPEVKIL